MARKPKPLAEVDANAVASPIPASNASAKSRAPVAKTAPDRLRGSNPRHGTGSAAPTPSPTDPSPPSQAPPPKRSRQLSRKAGDNALDVSGITLEDEDAFYVPIYDTCDTVRRKIRALLALRGVTKAAFLRAIVTAAYGNDPAAPKINPGSLASFLKPVAGAHPNSGNTSVVFYPAYVFFEKARLRDRKAKSADRRMMEELYPSGVDTESKPNMHFIGPVGAEIGIDKFGMTFVSPA